MRHSFEYANLYVEKYDNGKLLLDFTVESEFLYFAYNGDYTENKRLEQCKPTMLYFCNVEHIHLAEGDIITVSMRQLINHKEYSEKAYSDNIQDNETPYNIFMSFANGSWLEELFNTGEAFKNNRLKRQLIEFVEGPWQDGSPCTLNELSDEINVEVVDVGQGSTNLIQSNESLTIFDFGANIFASKSKLKSIADEITHKSDKAYKTSLVISHWDCDHYNLLTVLDNNWLRRLCCVFFPAEVISLTSKQMVKRLFSNCKYICTFKSPSMKVKGTVGMIPIISSSNYSLYIGYIGEKSRSINKSGLALAIKSSNDITILGADHANKQIWEFIYPHTVSIPAYNRLNIVVPHHGGKCGKINVSHFSINPGIAAISVGKNTYKHPNQATIDKYEDLGFDVKRTDWERKNILIEMK